MHCAKARLINLLDVPVCAVSPWFFAQELEMTVGTHPQIRCTAPMICFELAHTIWRTVYSEAFALEARSSGRQNRGVHSPDAGYI